MQEIWLPAAWTTGGVAAAPPVVVLVAGLLLVVFGRRLYWLLVGLAGFAAGSYLAWRFLAIDPETTPAIVPLAIGVLAGLVAAAAVILFQKLTVAMVGFAAGGIAMLWLAATLRWDAGYWVLVAALAAAIGGALVARSLFELALVVLTSIAGAALCVSTLTPSPRVAALVFALLAVGGVWWQLAAARRRDVED